MPRKLKKLDIHFTLSGSEDDSNLQVLTDRGGLLRSLSFDFPHLQELRITYLATMRSLIVDPSDSLFPFQGLRTLHLANILDSFEAQLWQALSVLPDLNKLEASATGSGTELRGCRGFPSLTDLTLDISTWSVVDLVLNAITSPSLKRVEIRHERDGRFELPQHTFATAMSLLSKSYSQTLRTVKIFLQIPAGGNRGVGDGIYLLAARGIESFDFTRWPMDYDEDIQVDLPNDILCNMGTSWPLLTRLVMDPGLRTYPTTASVTELLSSCPALDILELEGVTVSPRSAMEYPPPQFPHGLRFLALGAFVGDSDTMAEVLDHAFRDPEIAKLYRSFQGDEDVDQEYKALKDALLKRDSLRETRGHT
ncbi:hypothetical protein CERSUDRAFT_96565 [Gelatoporia subvermispora B]|uniref:F-box domain-containing protein n=1 Tax=Ceriporiopsis subvermispora (strain B) TaxID=914234 RepID=M2PHE0_CERS8|nr:hypothetical protein CERSUDRAFT_96565 [Gelatoporia subvermispora B]